MKKYKTLPFFLIVFSLMSILPNSLVCQDASSHLENSWNKINNLQLKQLDRELLQTMIDFEDYLYASNLNKARKDEYLWRLYSIALNVEDLEIKLQKEPKLLYKVYEFEGIKNLISNPAVSENYLDKAITTLNNHELSYRLYRWMSLAKSFVEKVEEGITYHHKSIEAIKLYFPPDSEQRENQLFANYLGLVSEYLKTGDFKSAKKYSNLGLVSARKLNSDIAYMTAITSKLQELRLTDSPEKVIELVNQYQDMIHKLSSNGKAVIYQILGDALFETKQYEEAIAAMLKSQSFNVHEVNKFTGQQTIGESYLRLAEFDLAIDYFDEMIHFFNEKGGNESRKAEALYMRALCYKSIQNLEQARTDVFKALHYQDDFNNKKINYHSLATEIYMDLFDQSQNEIYVDSAVAHVSKTDSLINRLRIDRRFFEDEIQLGARFYNAYASNLNTYSRLHDHNPKLVDQEQLFHYFENLKAHSLKKLLHTDNAAPFGNIPDSIRQKERVFKSKLSKLEENIYESKGQELDSNNQILNLKLDKIKDEYYGFINELEKDYPSYFRHQYNYESITLQELQESIDPDERIIEYFISDKNIFQLVISSESCKYFRNPIPTDWLNNIELFRSYMADPASRVDSFEVLAHYFYNHILKEAVSEMPSEVERLKIVPDDVLNFIPFELLIDSMIDQKNYHSLNYLQKKFTFSYIPSSSLFLKSLNAPDASYKYDYVGIAPTYSATATESGRGISNQRKTQSDLPFARESVRKAAELFEGFLFTGSDATVQSFVDHANDAAIIHLAMHGVIDLDKPSFSNLLFYGIGDENKLYAADVLGLELTSELAVLSACNTGIGKVINGDGIQNMSRAFIFAGVKNTIMSLWSLPDVQTMTVNDIFFSQIKEGESIDVALRNAKLNYLSESSQLRAHPYYWAGLVANGSMKAIQTTSVNFTFLTIGALVFLAFLSIVAKKLISKR